MNSFDIVKAGAKETAKILTTINGSRLLFGRSIALISAHPVAVTLVATAAIAIFVIYKLNQQKKDELNNQVTIIRPVVEEHIADHSVDDQNFLEQPADQPVAVADQSTVDQLPVAVLQKKSEIEILNFPKKLEIITINFISIDERLALFKNPGDISTEAQEKFATLMDDFFGKDEASDYDKLCFITTLHDIPFKDQEECLSLACQFTNPDSSLANKIEMLTAFKAMNSEKRNECISFLVNFFKPQIGHATRIEVLNILQKLEMSKYSKFLDQMCYASMEISYKVAAIKALISFSDLIQSIPLHEMSECFELEGKISNFGMDMADRVKIFKAIVALTSKERANVFIYFEKIGAKKNKDIMECLESIIKLPADERERCLFFTARPELTPRVRISKLKELAQTSTAERATFFSLISKLTPTIAVFEAVLKMELEEREQMLCYLEMLFTKNTSLADRMSIFNWIKSVSNNNRADFVEDLFCLFEGNISNNKMIKLNSLNIYQIADIIHHSAEFFKKTENNLLTFEIMSSLQTVPKEERAAYVQSIDIPALNLMKQLSVTPMICYYLLGESLRDFQSLKLLQSKPQMLKDQLLKSLEEKLFSTHTHPLTLIGLKSFIDYNQELLQIHQGHKLVRRSEEIDFANETTGPKHFLNIYNKLEEFSFECANFKPKEMYVFGKTVAFNITQLKKLSFKTTIKREDLPQNATFEAYLQLIKALQNKIFKNGVLDLAAIDAIDQLIDLGPVVEKPNTRIDWFIILIFQNQPAFFKQLMNTLGSEVSDEESQWKAILRCILEKDKATKKGNFFTEQEEMLIKFLSVMKDCDHGKKGQITTLYYNLEPKYQYDIAFSGSKESANTLEDDRNTEAFKFMKDFIKDQPIKTIEACIPNLISHVNNNLKVNSGLVTPLIENDCFWSGDEETLELKLNERGAIELLRQANKEEVKPKVVQALNQMIFKFMESKFNGLDKMMQELTGQKDVKEAAHQITYLKNLIGTEVGVGSEMETDIFTAFLSNKLVGKSKNEALSIFFRHVTPQKMVDALKRMIDSSSNENKQLLKQFIGLSEKDEIKAENVLQLLQDTNILTSKS